jgi:hypothetical protein
MNLVSLLGMIFMIWLKVNQENTFFCWVSIIER